MNENLKGLTVFTPEVSQALDSGLPVVALESTVIAHGLPHPLNLEVAAGMESKVREGKATPATIAILDGKIHIGLTESELERVGAGSNIVKANIGDLPVLLAKGESGATTVSATSYLAWQAGIRVFATGGIGGVHRNWEETLDISADLPAVATTPVVTVCSGAKSVLDVPATFEWLETHGVTVVGFQTNTFPAFYSTMSHPPLYVDVRADTPEDAAGIFSMRLRLGLPGGVLVGVPVPREAALPYAEVERAIRDALRTASEQGIKGKQITPFLLNSLAQWTGGRSLTANRALLENNAAVAAQISRAITKPRYV